MGEAKWRQSQAEKGRKTTRLRRCAVSTPMCGAGLGELLWRDASCPCRCSNLSIHPPTTCRPDAGRLDWLEPVARPQLLRMGKVWPHYFDLVWERSGSSELSGTTTEPTACLRALAGWYALYRPDGRLPW